MPEPVLTRAPDSSIQKPNRLDPPLGRRDAAHPRKNTGHGDGIRGLAVLQHDQQLADFRQVDAHVCDSEPELCAGGLYDVYS